MNTEDEPQAFDRGGVFVSDDYFPGFEAINTTREASENDERKEPLVELGGALPKTSQTQSTEFAGNDSEELRYKETPAEAWSRLLVKSLAMSNAQEEAHVDDAHSEREGATMAKRIKETQLADHTDGFEEGMGLLSLFLSEDTYATLTSLDSKVVFSFVSRILSEASVRSRSVLISVLRLLLEANDEAKDLLLHVRVTTPRAGVGAEQKRLAVSGDEPTRTTCSTGDHEGSFFEVMSSVANEQARKMSNLSQYFAFLRLRTYEALRGVLAFIIRMGPPPEESTIQPSLDVLLCRAAVFVLLPSFASNRSLMSEPWILGDTATPIAGELTFVNREIFPFLATNHSFRRQTAGEVLTSDPETNASVPLFSDARSPNTTCDKNSEGTGDLASTAPSNAASAAPTSSDEKSESELEHRRASVQSLSYCVSSSSDWGNVVDRLVSSDRSSSRRASVDTIPLPTSDAFTLVVGDILVNAIVGRALSSLVPCWISEYFFNAWEAVSDIGTLVDESICGPLEVAEEEWRAGEGSRVAKAVLLQMRGSSLKGRGGALLSEPTASSSAVNYLTQEQNNQKGEKGKKNVQTEGSNVYHEEGIHSDSTSSASISSEANGTECEGINAERYSTCITEILSPTEHADNSNVTDDSNFTANRTIRVNLSASAVNGSQVGNNDSGSVSDKGRTIREYETPNKIKGLNIEEKLEAIGGGERPVHDNDEEHSIVRSSKVVKAVRRMICGRILGHTEKSTRKFAKKRSTARLRGENTSKSSRSGEKRGKDDADEKDIDDEGEDNDPFGNLNRNYLTEQGVHIIVSPLAKLIIVAAILFVWLATFLSYRITRETLRRFDRLESIAAEQRRDILLTKRLRKKRAIAVTTTAAGAPFLAAAPTTTHPSGLNKSLLAACPSPSYNNTASLYVQYGGTPSNHHQPSHHNSRRASGVPQYGSASLLHSPALHPAQHARTATNSSPASSGQFSRRDLHVHVSSDTTISSHASPQSHAAHNHNQLHHGVPASRNQPQSAHSPSTVSLQPRVGGSAAAMSPLSQGGSRAATPQMNVDQRHYASQSSGPSSLPHLTSNSPPTDRDLLAFPTYRLPTAQVAPMAAVRLCHSGDSVPDASSASSTPQTSPRLSPTRSLSLSPAVSGRSRSTTTVSKGPSSFNSTSRPPQSLDNTVDESSNTRNMKSAAHASGGTVIGLDPRRSSSGADTCTKSLTCAHDMAQTAAKVSTYACAGVPPLAPPPSRSNGLGVPAARATAAVELTPSDIHLDTSESGSQNSVLPNSMETTAYASSRTTASPDVGSNTLSLGLGIEDGDSGLVVGPLGDARPTDVVVAPGSLAEGNVLLTPDLTAGRDDPLAQPPQPQTNGLLPHVGPRSPSDEDPFSSRAISSLLDS